MDKEDRRAAAPKDKFLVLPPILALSLTIVTLVIPDVAPHFFPGGIFAFRSDVDLRPFDVSFLFIGVMLLAFQLTKCVFAVRGRRLKKFLSYGLSVTIVILSLFNFRSITEELQVVRFHIFPQHFYSCAQSAEKYSDTSALRICSARTHGNSVLTIVFDSGSEIELPVANRSTAFTGFLRHQIGPLLSQCEVYVRDLSRHFFLVRSDCG